MTYNSAYTGPQIDRAARIAAITFDDLADMLADAGTYTSHTAGDVFWTAAEGFRYEVAASGATDHELTTAGGAKLYVLPTPEGAIPYAACNPLLDTETYDASAANQAAFTAAIAACVRLGIQTVALSAGTIWMRADNGTVSGSGLRINVPDNKTVRFFGQAGTVIKRIALDPPVTLALSSGLVFLSQNTGVTIEWHHVTFDGNDAGTATTVGNFYRDEQSANIRWIDGTGTPKAIRFFHCDVAKGRVGDGYLQSRIVDHFMAANCTTHPETVRRPRADWQFSRFATYETVMENIVCNGWESEPSSIVEGSRLIMTNVVARSVFDISGDAENSFGNRRPLDVHLTNVVCVQDDDNAGYPFVNFHRVHGTIVNCHFRGIDRIQQCQLKFFGGSITVKNGGDGAAKAVEVWYDHDDEGAPNYTENSSNFVEFHGVSFKKDADVTTGLYVRTMETVEISDVTAGIPLPRLALIDCHVRDALDRVVSQNRCGVLELRGGDLRGNTSIFYFGNDTTKVAHLVCEISPLWRAPALCANNLAFSPTTGETIINLSGQFDGENMVLWDNGGNRITSGGATVWNNTAVAIVTSHPQGRIRGVPGLRAKLRNQAYGEPTIWETIPTGTMTATGYNGTDWRALSWPARTAAPTTGAWARGDIVWNINAAAAGWAGWICVTAGTPGTWKQFGAIEA